MREVPLDYHGREQTYLKHRILEEYLEGWSHKLGSRAEHLWYVDVFAGPWESQSPERRDTSIAIGLGALAEAAQSWAAHGRRITLHAIFVEKDPAAYRKLVDFVQAAKGAVDVHTFEGAFGDHVAAIDALIGGHPAFVFVDPTGWNGADLGFVATLARVRGRDLLVNVMCHHLIRFKDDPRDFLRRQMKAFFGLGDESLPAGMSEEDLMALYRAQLRSWSGAPWVADLAVPMPVRERTNFRLVVAGHHPKVVELFRDVEAKVIGREAGEVRAAAHRRDLESRTGQMALLATAPPEDPRYATMRADAEQVVRAKVERALAGGRSFTFGQLWPELLCEAHLRLTDLSDLVLEWEARGEIQVVGRKPRQRKVHDDHVLRRP